MQASLLSPTNLPSSKLIDTTSPVIDILIPENDSVYNLDDDSSTFNIILELKENIWCRSRSDEFNFIAFNIQSTTGYHMIKINNSVNGWIDYRNALSFSEGILEYSVDKTILGTDQVSLSVIAEDFAGNRITSNSNIFYVE